MPFWMPLSPPIYEFVDTHVYAFADAHVYAIVDIHVCISGYPCGPHTNKMYTCMHLWIHLSTIYEFVDTHVSAFVDTHLYTFANMHLCISGYRCGPHTHTRYTCMHLGIHLTTYICGYGVVTMSRLLKMIGLFCRIESLLQSLCRYT